MAVHEIEFLFRRSGAVDDSERPVEYHVTLNPRKENEKIDGKIKIDFANFRSLNGKSENEYGKALSEVLFANETIKSSVSNTWDLVKNDRTAVMRILVHIDNSAILLHGIHWETVVNPVTKRPFIHSQQVRLMRYIDKVDEIPGRSRSVRPGLLALAAVANPEGADLNVSFELERARKGFAPIPVIFLPGKEGEYCTLDNLVEKAADADILYLVCHGNYSVKIGSQLLLENNTGQRRLVNAKELADAFVVKERCPRLIILVACKSAGDEDENPLYAVGPLLVQAGAPAVLAFQGLISIENMRLFLPELLQRLSKAPAGRIDYALAHAYKNIWRTDDWWKPVLFTNRSQGSLWQRKSLEDWWAQRGYGRNPFSWKDGREVREEYLEELYIDPKAQ